MFQAKPMQPSDFDYAADLANTMDWNMTIKDFAYNSSLEPDGCLVLYDDYKKLGIATCISYGKTGWFGNLIVDAASRRLGAGRFLVQHAVKYLQDKGVESIGLYAYPYLSGFYGKIGFIADVEYTVLKASCLKPVDGKLLNKIDSQNLPKVAELDTYCFGGNRKRLLESILRVKGNLGYCIYNGKEVKGYIMAKVYEGMAEVGPLVCQTNHPDIALNLLKGTLQSLEGLDVYLYLPKNQTQLQNYLRSVGFVEQFSLTRMFLSRNLSKNCIYIAESLERG